MCIHIRVFRDERKKAGRIRLNFIQYKRCKKVFRNGSPIPSHSDGVAAAMRVSEPQVTSMISTDPSGKTSVM